jgi:hypothetical protein
MTCGFQDKSFAFTLLVTYAYRMHIQDGGMHVAFHQNKSIYFETQERYGIIVKEVYLFFISENEAI